METCPKCGGFIPGFGSWGYSGPIRICSCGSYPYPMPAFRRAPWEPQRANQDDIIAHLEQRVKQLEQQIERYAAYERNRWEQARNTFGIDNGFKFDKENGYWGPG